MLLNDMVLKINVLLSINRSCLFNSLQCYFMNCAWRLFQQIDQNINAAYTEAVKSCLYENVVYWPDKTIR